MHSFEHQITPNSIFRRLRHINTIVFDHFDDYFSNLFFKHDFYLKTSNDFDNNRCIALSVYILHRFAFIFIDVFDTNWKETFLQFYFHHFQSHFSFKKCKSWTWLFFQHHNVWFPSRFLVRKRCAYFLQCKIDQNTTVFLDDFHINPFSIKFCRGWDGQRWVN